MKKEQCDVLIVGSGFAGLSAAFEAAEKGLDVVVLEKMHTPGGNSRISDGGVAAPGTVLQEKHGIEDSPNLMMQDMLNAGKGRNDPELVSIVCEGAKEAFEWTQSLGVEYEDRVDLFGGHSQPRSYVPKGTLSGRPLLQALLKHLKRKSVRFYYQTYVEDLAVDNHNRVVGAHALHPYHFTKDIAMRKIFFEAHRGVVIASGGYGADNKLQASIDPKLESISTTNMPSATGELLRAAQAVGAGLRDMDCIQLAPWASPDEQGMGAAPVFGDYIVLPYGVIVEKATGKRFVDELADRDTVAKAILQLGEPAIGLADTNALNHGGISIDKALRKNVVRRFETLEDLAAHYGINADALKATIEETNEGIRNGKDPFKVNLSNRAVPIETPPFYAMRMWPKVHHTMGGLRIDKMARVLSDKLVPIEGLYAAGEAAAGVHGAGRLGSCAITDCLVMGRIAGKSASQ